MNNYLMIYIYSMLLYEYNEINICEDLFVDIAKFLLRRYNKNNKNVIKKILCLEIENDSYKVVFPKDYEEVSLYLNEMYYDDSKLRKIYDEIGEDINKISSLVMEYMEYLNNKFEFMSSNVYKIKQ